MPPPTSIVWLTSFVSTSIRLTVPSLAFVTHTDPSPTATPAGEAPTLIDGSITEPSSRARRATTPRSGWATQRLPNPIALAPGRCPSSVASSRLPSSGSIRAIEFAPRSIAVIVGEQERQPDRDQDRRRAPRRRSPATEGGVGAAAPAATDWRERAQPLDRVDAVRHDPDERDRFAQSLQRDRAAVLVPDALDPSREVGDLARRQDLAGERLTAQTRGQVQRAASIAALDLDGLAGIESDPDRERELGIGEGLLDEPLLEVGGRSDRLTRRAEDAHGLVATKLEELATSTLHDLAHEPGELRRQLPGRLVAPLLREDRLAADVGDQERPDVKVVGALVPAWRLLTGHARLCAPTVARS